MVSGTTITRVRAICIPVRLVLIQRMPKMLQPISSSSTNPMSKIANRVKMAFLGSFFQRINAMTMPMIQMMNGGRAEARAHRTKFNDRLIMEDLLQRIGG